MAHAVTIYLLGDSPINVRIQGGVLVVDNAVTSLVVNGLANMPPSFLAATNRERTRSPRRGSMVPTTPTGAFAGSFHR
jgi:hypothetical protein